MVCAEFFFNDEEEVILLGLSSYFIGSVLLLCFLKYYSLKSEGNDLLNYYRELLSDDEISTLGLSVELADTIIEKYNQFLTEITPTIQNKNQFEKQASILCGFANFFHRHQRIEQTVSANLADHNETDPQLVLLATN